MKLSCQVEDVLYYYKVWWRLIYIVNRYERVQTLPWTLLRLRNVSFIDGETSKPYHRYLLYLHFELSVIANCILISLQCFVEIWLKLLHDFKSNNCTLKLFFPETSRVIGFPPSMLCYNERQNIQWYDAFWQIGSKYSVLIYLCIFSANIIEAPTAGFRTLDP